MAEFTKYSFQHYQLPVTILWSAPKESFVKGMRTLLKDIEENGVERWTVKELEGRIGVAPKEEDDCCPPATPSAKQGAIAQEFEV